MRSPVVARALPPPMRASPTAGKAAATTGLGLAAAVTGLVKACVPAKAAEAEGVAGAAAEPPGLDGSI